MYAGVRESSLGITLDVDEERRESERRGSNSLVIQAVGAHDARRVLPADGRVFVADHALKGRADERARRLGGVELRTDTETAAASPRRVRLVRVRSLGPRPCGGGT